MRAALAAFEHGGDKESSSDEEDSIPLSQRTGKLQASQQSPRGTARAAPATSSAGELSDPEERRQYIYGLATQAALPKQKSAADPTNLRAVLTAAEKAAKDADAKLLSGLEPPEFELRTDATARTGLHNLGATCYMNALL